MKIKSVGFLAGLAIFVAILCVPTPASFVVSAQQFIGAQPAGLTAPQLGQSMQAVLAVLALMVVWWLTEAVPLPATALLPAVLFPLLKITGVQGRAVFEFSSKNTLLKLHPAEGHGPDRAGAGSPGLAPHRVHHCGRRRPALGRPGIMSPDPFTLRAKLCETL